ncbi:PDR/VanB family oxidoreductase [Xenorhabdus innexi]|uniref:Carnitine monooxygenase reductase subunit n=1 Tax=Xenorhabdus innexi TaxID=290109 RepID=A0A1N6MRI1_9GAMM|nr:PDR/VanB family oxidoreductase [Xenorhabdus innexi]PHM38466.1 oxidoreductase [Xenorhabdus innexi]SIP71458.1 putative dioxygenase subunit beta yeaX [Xenorhabdus innexi]
MATYQMLGVIVSDIEIITPTIKRFTLIPDQNTYLPSFTAGSHIFVQMQDGSSHYSNAYSLLNSPFDEQRYQIAIKREANSRGGSAFMHEKVTIGDKLLISQPNNLFSIVPDAKKHILIAGGIGITPFMSHLHQLEQQSADYELHYCYRNAGENAFRQELMASPFKDKVVCHVSSEGSRIDLDTFIAQLPEGSHIYTCGSTSLSEGVKQAAQKTGVPQHQLHFEQFAVEDKTGDAFTLVLARSGIELEVDSESTILQVIERNNAACVESLCREGICGTCETVILEGEADHRDQYFSDEERESQASLLLCCSRAKGKRLVIDL